MLNQLVNVKLHKANEPKLYFVEELNGNRIVLHDILDIQTQVTLSDIASISVVDDEDEMQEFITSMLFTRKDNALLELASTVLTDMDNIIKYCPETRDTLLEQLVSQIKVMDEMQQEDEEDNR